MRLLANNPYNMVRTTYHNAGTGQQEEANLQRIAVPHPVSSTQRIAPIATGRQQIGHKDDIGKYHQHHRPERESPAHPEKEINTQYELQDGNEGRNPYHKEIRNHYVPHFQYLDHLPFRSVRVNRFQKAGHQERYREDKAAYIDTRLTDDM